MPQTAPIPMPTKPTGPNTANAPVTPKDWSPANADPAATFPIPAWTPAATEPPTIPDVVNPAPVRATQLSLL